MFFIECKKQHVLGAVLPNTVLCLLGVTWHKEERLACYNGERHQVGLES